MAKKIKEKTGRVIEISKADNILFKKYLIALEEAGVEKNPTEVASDLFSIGLRNEFEMLSKER
jgi:hypothetical protein